MRCLIISGTYTPDKCGVGDYSKNLYDNIKNKMKIDLMTSDFSIENNIRRARNNNWGIINIFKISKEIKIKGYEVVNIQFPTKKYRKKIGIILLPFLLKLRRVKTILTLHEYSYSPQIAKLRTVPMIIFSDCIICVDRKYVQDINKLKKNVKMIEIASNIPESKLNYEEKKVLRARISNSKILVGYFGFVNESKGIESILYVIKKMIKEDIDISLLLLCELRDNDSYHMKIKNLISELQIENNVIITGYIKDQKDVANLISILDYMILPFKNGLSSRNGSYLAAKMQGVKVISTRPNEFNEFNDNNTYFIENYTKIDEIIYIINNHINDYSKKNDNINWYKIANKYCEVINSMK